MKFLRKLKFEWQAYNKKNYNDNPLLDNQISFENYVLNEINKVKKLNYKVEYLQKLISDLNENLFKVKNEKQDYYIYNISGTTKEKMKVVNGEPEYTYSLTKKEYELFNDFNNRILTIYSYLLKFKDELFYWKELLNSNSDINFSKITWLKNKQDLVSLFDTLENLGYIPFNKNKDEIIRNHFTWPERAIGKNDLKSHRNNMKNKSEIYLESDNIKIVKNKLKTKDIF